MAENRDKPPGKAPAEDSSTKTGAGRVGQNDRGNMGWQWADDEDLQADDTLGAAERIRALVDPTLKVEEEDLTGNSPIKSNPKGITKGYNPYNSGALGKVEWKKKKDLHQLSKWIELRKKLQHKDEGGSGEGSGEET
jgi:hypothetical protein